MASLKSNVGHTEIAAGLLSLIKVGLDRHTRAGFPRLPIVKTAPRPWSPSPSDPPYLCGRW